MQNSSVHLWLEAGASPSKLVLGLATYGQTFTVNNNNGPLHVPSDGPGEAGPYTQQPVSLQKCNLIIDYHMHSLLQGFIGYFEQCTKMQQDGDWVTETNDFVQGPWSYRGNQWVGYDNPESIANKVNESYNSKLNQFKIIC